MRIICEITRVLMTTTLFVSIVSEITGKWWIISPIKLQNEEVTIKILWIFVAPVLVMTLNLKSNTKYQERTL